VVGVVGSPLTGKGLFAHEWIAAPGVQLRLVWSPVEATDKYCERLAAPPTLSIVAMVAALKNGAPSIVFVPSQEPEAMEKQFDRFCRVAWQCEGSRVLVEELSRVTTAGWSPPAWRNITTAGSHRGLEVMGTIQRAARVDKDFFDACTEIRCYRQNRAADAAAIAAEIPGATADEIRRLPERAYLHFHRPDRLERGVQPLPPGARAQAPRPARSRTARKNKSTRKPPLP